MTESPSTARTRTRIPWRLVVLGASATALAVVRDAARYGVRSIVVDQDDGPAAHSRHVDMVRVPPATQVDTLAAVLAAGEGGENVLIATSDVWLRFLMKHRDEVDRAYRCVIQPSTAVIGTCLEKSAFLRFCAAQGLLAPPWWIPDGRPSTGVSTFPAIVRPDLTRHGDHGVPVAKAVLVHSQEELDASVAAVTATGCGAVATVSLLGRRVSQYALAFSRSKMHFNAFVTHKIFPVPDACGTGTLVELRPQAAVLAAGRALVEALDYHGIGEVEVLHDDDTGECFLIELNARPWLQYGLVLAAGHDFLGPFLGRERRQSAQQSGHCWWAPWDDLYNAFSRTEGAVTTGRVRLRDYLMAVARVDCQAIFSFKDPGPAVHAWFGRG